MNDRQRFSHIAHRYLPFAAPIARETIEQLLALLSLGPESAVLDLGCGRATLLLRIVEQFHVKGIGVDIDAQALNRARQEAADRGLAERVTLFEQPALESRFERPFDLAVCIGSSHACGGYRETLQFLSRQIKPQGYILCGEGFWRQEPEPAYLASFGGQADELQSHYENVATAQALGLAVVWTAVSSDESWDNYEGLYRLAMSQYLAENPTDPAHAAFRQRSESWYNSYLRWGRETMGFALYLFRAHTDYADLPASLMTGD